MADIRVYQQSIDVIGEQATPDLRVYQQSIDVIGEIATPDLRVYQQSLDVIGEIDAPGLQVSQQNVQVLGTKTGDARISRVYLERLVGWVPGDNTYTRSKTDSLSIMDAARYTPRKLPVTSALSFSDSSYYVGPIDLSASSTLSFTDVARIADVLTASGSSTLTLTQSLVQSGTIPLSVNQSLSLGSYADTSTKIRGVLDTLTLTQTASANWIIVVEDTLSLTQLAEGYATRFASSTLTLTDSAVARHSKFTESIEHTLTFSEATMVYPHYGRATHTLTLTQTVDYVSPHSESVEHELITSEYEEVDGEWILVVSGLSDSVSLAESTRSTSNTDYIQWFETIAMTRIQVNATAVNAISDLVLTDSASTSIIESVEQTLTLTQTATAEITITANSTLALTDAAGVLRVLSLSVTSDLNIQSAFELTPDDTEVCTYDPSMGSSTDPTNPVPRPLSSSFTISRQNTITLAHPWTNPSNTITLRVPELGNKNVVELQRINRKTRGGTLIVWSDPQWPKNEKLMVEIKAMIEAKVAELVVFIALTLGQEFGYTDWENNTYKVVLLNPDTAIQRDGTCKLSANLEFEVTRSDPSWTGQDTLDLTQAVGLTHILGEPIAFVDTIPLQQTTSYVKL